MGTTCALHIYGNVCTACPKISLYFIINFRILQGSKDTADNSNDGGPEFAEVFVIVWVGSMIVTLNSKLLGGNM